MIYRAKKYSQQDAKKDLPQIKKSENKTRGGKCLIVAGSANQWGAAVLCATAAARVGSGYVTVFDMLKDFPTCQHPDFLITQSMSNLAQHSAMALGPGFQHHAQLLKLMKTLQGEKFSQVVLDAEALNAISALKELPKLLPSWIATPHEGELSRLLNVSAKKIRANRRIYIKHAQRKLNCIVVLKGYRTLVATHSVLWEIQSGNSSLAKAGTGDVLTGMIAGFLSQGLQPEVAACLAAYVHGFIADQWIAEGNDQLSLLASDILIALPKALKLIR